MNIYLASSWRNTYQPYVLGALREAGHTVYDFRNPAPGESGFSWKSIESDWQNWTPAQWRGALAHPIAQAGYRNDRNGMDAAQVGVLLLPSGRSAHLEAGFMAGQGKPVLTLAFDPIEPDLMNLLLGSPGDICTSQRELLDRLDRLAANLGL